MITNSKNISPALAVWLLDDDYDYLNKEKHISVTTLIKPTKQLVLGIRAGVQQVDLTDLIAQQFGKTIHAGIEKAWTKNNGESAKKSLIALGYPKDLVDQMRVNPTEPHPTESTVWVEIRGQRKIKDWTISGKFDLIIGGQIQDTKSTSAYAWVMGRSDTDFAYQGSIYKWIHADKVTDDVMQINYVFTDWQKAQAKSNPNYPDTRIKEKKLPLYSTEEVEQYIFNKIEMFEKYMEMDEDDMQQCTPEELWMSPPKYKYYSDPEKAKDPTARSTRTFNSFPEAMLFQQSKGKGQIVSTKSEPKKCLYCKGFSVCKQKDNYDFPSTAE